MSRNQIIQRLLRIVFAMPARRSQRAILCYLAVLTATAAAPGGASAAEFWVNARTGADLQGDGSQSAPWATISKAAAVAGGGAHTIHIAGGVYRESLVIRRGGQDKRRRLMFLGDPAWRPTILPAGRRALYVRDGSSFLHFQDIVLDGRFVEHEVVKLEAQTPLQHVSFLQCEIKNGPRNGLFATDNANSIVIERCDVHHNGRYGIYLKGDDCIIHRCQIYDNDVYGIHIWPSGDWAQQQHNPSQGNRIEGNRIWGNSKVLAAAGILVGRGDANRITNNVVFNERVGIHIWDQQNSLVAFNSVYRCSLWGLRIGGSSHPGSPPQCCIDFRSQNNTVIGNVAYLSGLLDVSIQGAVSQELNKIGPNFTSNPDYAHPDHPDPKLADFHLDADSDCIDTGDFQLNGLISYDFDGWTRDRLPDYGADEYGNSGADEVGSVALSRLRRLIRSATAPDKRNTR